MPESPDNPKMNPPNDPNAKKLDDENYRLIIGRAWEDIHHSRNQDWRALILVAGLHFAALQIPKGENQSLQVDTHLVMGALALFATIGMVVTFRHCHLMRVKLGWIYLAERHLGLIMKEEYEDGDSVPMSELGIIPKNERMEKMIPWRASKLSLFGLKCPLPGPTKRWFGVLRVPRPNSTSFLLGCFYLLLIAADIYFMLQ